MGDDDTVLAELDAGELETLAALVAGGGVVVLSGAGLSTESGIPDYRGPTGLARGGTPMSYQTFTRDPLARRRYWARSQLGWRRIADARPNQGHIAVAQLQASGLVTGVITQNVDGLHQRAGADQVVELHGNLHRVVCLDCGDGTPRPELDSRLRAVNVGWDPVGGPMRPDGDLDLSEADLAGFRVVGCTACGGLLKPDVVFFGETVPSARVQDCFGQVEGARLLLVLGSSLTVMSGYRFVLRAASVGVPVAIVNQGVTRGDARAALTVDAPLGQVLPALATQVLRATVS